MVILLAIGVFSSFIASISSTLNTLRMSRVENSKHLDVDFPHGCFVGEMDGGSSVRSIPGRKQFPNILLMDQKSRLLPVAVGLLSTIIYRVLRPNGGCLGFLNHQTI